MTAIRIPQFAAAFAVAFAAPLHAEYEYQSLSRFGVSGDSVSGVRIQSDGNLAVAANLSGGPVFDSLKTEAGGIVLRLNPAGNKILSSLRVGSKIRDLAIDGKDNIVVATEDQGVVKLDPTAAKVLWKFDTEGPACRVDAGEDGTVAALRYDRPDEDTKTGSGQIYTISPDGKKLGQFKGHRETLDLCIDTKSKTVIHIGWRQENSWEGKRVYPVQISNMRGCAYDGTVKYTLYDWSKDKDADDFLNKPSNNMADTRGYRVSMGADGMVHAAFECAGGNHIFRYEPGLTDGKWVDAKDKKTAGGPYHDFFKSRSEHKTYLCQYDPSSGEFLRGVGFCTRTSKGDANAVRMKHGAVAGLADGSVICAGDAAASLPVTLNPENSGDYMGGAFALLMDDKWKERELVTRIQPGGSAHAVDARDIKGTRVIVIAGSTAEKEDEAFSSLNPLSAEGGEPNSAFIGVIGGR